VLFSARCKSNVWDKRPQFKDTHLQVASQQHRAAIRFAVLGEYAVVILENAIINYKNLFNVKNNQIQSRKRGQVSTGWEQFAGEARTRILLWFVALLFSFIAVSVPTIRLRLFNWVDQRVRQELAIEMAEFKNLLAEGITDEDSALLAELRRENRPIPDGPPETEAELKTIIEVFMIRELPEDDTFFIAFVDGQFHKSSPRALPPILGPSSDLIQRLSTIVQAEGGEQLTTDSKEENVLYLAEPIRIEDDLVGVFITAHTTMGEREEVLETTRIILEVGLVVLLSVLVLAWFAAGKILAPLRVLRTTAQSISESDLEQRISVQGNGEIADLAATFNDMMDRLETAFATQRNFINDAGHELRTPVTIIRGHLELMGNDPIEQQETIALVLDELDRVSRLVEDLILLAKAERPDFLLLETVETSAFTEAVLMKAKALADRNWKIDAIAKTHIVGDRQRLTQAMMNLAQNATQHTIVGDTIAIGSAVEHRHLRLWVRDTGEGIPPDEQERIFQRFARVAHSRRRSDGAGLGLAIVKAIAEAHTGKVVLQSQPGIGSTFTLVLPLQPTTGIYRQYNPYASNFDRRR
jgi:signal transduction histidine kinase